jgi:hypothetical protein
MRRLTYEEAAHGKRVIYTGRTTPANVTDSEPGGNGQTLTEHHPGVINRVADDRRVFVDFLGLEHQPISNIGFLPDDDGHYPGLVLVGPDDWAAACAVGGWSALAG